MSGWDRSERPSRGSLRCAKAFALSRRSISIRTRSAAMSATSPSLSTTEELAYPAPQNRRLAKQVDQMARKAKVAVLGTGVNPGFAMDALPIAMTAVCEHIERVEVRR